MHQNRTLWVYLSLSWLAVTLASAYYQPFPLGDQLHYLGVAWEMWLQKHFFAPDRQRPPGLAKTAIVLLDYS